MTERDPQQEPALDRQVEEILRGVEGDIPEPVVALPRRPLDREERVIKDVLVRMGSLIEERIRLTVEALQTHDDAKALAVIEGDEEINALQVQAMDHVVLAIATQQPVARDLRFLLALDLIGSELERIGDMVANVAKRTRELVPEPPLEGHLAIPEMGRISAAVPGRDDPRPRRRRRRSCPRGGDPRRRDRRPLPPDLRPHPRAREGEPGQRRAGHAPSDRRPLHGAGR